MAKQRATDEKQWIQKAAQGDAGAFKKIYETYRQKVYWIAFKFTFHKETALDLTQDVFVKLYKNLHLYRGDAGFGPWLKRIAVNVCIDHLRRMRSQGVQASLSDDALSDEVLTGAHIEDGGDPADPVANRELAGKVMQAVEGLSVKHKEVFLLAALKEMSYNEMAEVIGCSVGTVMSRLFYARKYLQEALASDLGEA